MADQIAYFGENISFAAKEAYKRLRTNVLYSFADEKKCHIIGLSSSGPADGKSTTILNLAFAFFELGKKVLLIDGDMRRPSLNSKIEIEQAPGLSDILVNPEGCGKVITRFREGELNSVLDVLPAGNTPPNPSELLNSPRMENLLRKLSENYDFILVDLPPVGAVTDAQAVSRLTDGMILVVREGYANQDALDDCMAQLRLAKAKVLGFVLNGAREGSKKSYSYGYYK